MRDRLIVRSIMVAAVWLSAGMAWAADGAAPASTSAATHKTWHHHSSQAKTDQAAKPTTNVQTATDSTAKPKTRHAWMHKTK